MTTYRGRVRVTYQMLHEALGLPDEVEIDFQAEGDNKRRIGTFYIRSNEPITNLTFSVTEGGQPPDSLVDINQELVITRMRDIVETYDKRMSEENETRTKF